MMRLRRAHGFHRATPTCRFSDRIGGVPDGRAQVSKENKDLVREITEVGWNRRGLDRIAEFYALDFVGDDRPYALREGHEGVRAMVEGAWTPFPDYHEEVHELIAEGHRVVVDLTITGTQQGQWGPAGHREARPVR